MLAANCPLCESVVAGLDKPFVQAGEVDASGSERTGGVCDVETKRPTPALRADPPLRERDNERARQNYSASKFIATPLMQ